ncbi:hypothetical protein [Cysteiniphilum litorale]
MLFFSGYAFSADVIINLAPQNDYFVGRNSLLDQSSRILKHHAKILLSGTGGIGKTQIAKRYAWAHVNDYDVIWWINANQLVTAQAVDLAHKWNQSIKTPSIKISDDTDVVWNNVLAVLSETPKNWLIVYDDYQPLVTNTKYIDQILQYTAKVPTHHLIATSRNTHQKGNFTEMKPIDTFTRTESIELLNKLPKCKYKHKETLNELAALLKDYPLAIAQAFAYIKTDIAEMSADDYILYYKTKRETLTQAKAVFVQDNVDGSLIDNYRFTAEVTVGLTIDQIKKESQEAYLLLNFMSMFYHQSIPKQILLAYFDGDKAKLSLSLNILKKYGLVDEQIKNDGKTNDARGLDENKINEAYEKHKEDEKNKKNRKSKQQSENENTVTDDSLYSMHELIREIIFLNITDKEREKLLAKASAVLNKVMQDMLDYSIPLLTNQYYYLNHINHVHTQSINYQIYNDDLADIKIRELEYILTEKRDKDRSLQIINSIDFLLDKMWFVRPLTKARFLLMKAAYSAWMSDDLDLSIAQAKEAETYLKKQKSIRNEEYMMLYLRLSQNYVLQGDFENALKYTDLAEKIIQTDKTTNTGNIAVIFQAKAIALLDQGDFDQSLFYLDKANEASININRNCQTMLIAVYAYKIRLLIYKNEIQKSLDLAILAEEIIDRELPKKNYFSSVPLVARAHAYLALQEYDKAKKNVYMAITLLKDFYPNHAQKGNRRLGFAYQLAGDIEYAQKDYEKALVYYEKSEKMYETGLKYTKIREFSDLLTKMCRAYHRDIDLTNANRYYRKQMTLFGEYHTNSLDLKLYFAAVKPYSDL